MEYEKLSTKDDRIPKVTGKTDDADMQKVDQAVEEFAKEVQKEVKELLGVDDAQLEAAMKELGLTYQDLMDPVNLANLVMNLTGEEDQLGLLMNADFQELMQNVEVLSKNLLQELGMTPQEVAEVFAQLEQNAAQITEEVPQQMQEVTDTQADVLKVQQTDDVQITEQKSQVTGLTETNAAATESVESDGNVQNVEEPVSQEVRVENDQTASQQEGQQEEAPENSMTTEDDASLLQQNDTTEKSIFTEHTFQQTVQTIRTDNIHGSTDNGSGHRMLCLIR